LKLYIDTCVISGCAKDDFNPDDAWAFDALLEQHDAGGVVLITSAVAKRELDRIPPQWRASHYEVYQRLTRVHEVDYLVLDLFGISPLGIGQHPIYRKLEAILPDVTDAKHGYQAYREGAFHFITVDRSTILSKAKEIFEACKLEVFSPFEFMTK
jgi:hypothetical protein